MRKVFWDDPYQKHLKTNVSAVDGQRLLFDSTIAFSFSGGLISALWADLSCKDTWA